MPRDGPPAPGHRCAQRTAFLPITANKSGEEPDDRQSRHVTDDNGCPGRGTAPAPECSLTPRAALPNHGGGGGEARNRTGLASCPMSTSRQGRRRRERRSVGRRHRGVQVRPPLESEVSQCVAEHQSHGPIDRRSPLARDARAIGRAPDPTRCMSHGMEAPATSDLVHFAHDRRRCHRVRTYATTSVT